MITNTTGYEYNEKGFFIGANSILYRTDLKDKSKILYFHITNRYNFFLNANQVVKYGKIVDVEKVYCESQESMAAAIGYAATSKTKVNPLIKELEAAGLIKIVAKRDGKNSNWYIPLTVEGVPNITLPKVDESVMQNFSSKSVKREKPQQPAKQVQTPSPTPVTPTVNNDPYGWGDIDDLSDPF